MKIYIHVAALWAIAVIPHITQNHDLLSIWPQMILSFMSGVVFVTYALKWKRSR